MERPNKPSAIPVSPVVPAAQVSISEDNSRVTAILPSGDSIEVLLFGATVISWKSANGKENIFLSSKAHLDGSKAVRGGIPLVFPVFGPAGAHETAGLAQHGFARTSRWEYLGKSSSESKSVPGGTGDSSVKLDFGLSDAMLDEATRKKWSYPFGLTYSVTLSVDDLETSLVVRNTGKMSFDFQVLLHTYLRINSIHDVTIKGLEEVPFHDKVKDKKEDAASKPLALAQETDRVYQASDTASRIVVSEKNNPRFVISRDTLPDVVVWNPWEEKTKTMPDLGPENAYEYMICVEAGSVSNWNTLESGDAWEGGQHIKAL